MQMSPVRPSPSLANRVISTFSFDPKPLPSPQNLHRWEAIRPPGSVFGTTQASARLKVKEQWNVIRGLCPTRHE